MIFIVMVISSLSCAMSLDWLSNQRNSSFVIVCKRSSRAEHRPDVDVVADIEVFKALTIIVTVRALSVQQ